MSSVAKDSAGNEWEIISHTRHSRVFGLVSRWMARRVWLDEDGKERIETIKNKGGKTKRFQSEAACKAAVTGEPYPPSTPSAYEIPW